MKLHLACGDKYKTGWHNVDIRKQVKADQYANIIDLGFWNQIQDNSVDFIYHEHFIEHIDVQTAKWLLNQCYKKLKPGGVLRVATPDLQEVVSTCYNGTWKEARWLTEVPEGKYITTMAEFLNVGMRNWDHQFLYDEETLEKYCLEAGFKFAYRKQWGQSHAVELQNLETREDSKLIIEAVKV